MTHYIALWRHYKDETPQPVGKSMSLNDAGELVKQTLVPKTTHMAVDRFDSLSELVELIEEYPNTFFTAGLPDNYLELADYDEDAMWLETKCKNARGQGVARTRESMQRRAVPGFVVFDFDAAWWPWEGELPDVNELRNMVIEAVAIGGLDIDATPMLAYKSSGSSVVRESDGEVLDAGGRHLVMLVQDASDAERFADALMVYLAQVDGAYGAVSQAGTFLMRGILDKAAMRGNQPLFMGPACVGEGLRVARDLQILGQAGGTQVVDTRELADPDDAALKAARTFWREERDALADALKAAREDWAERHGQAYVERNPGTTLDAAKHIIANRVEGRLLASDHWHVDGHGWVRVAEVLADPSHFANGGKVTGADPVEPDYGSSCPGAPATNKAIFYPNADDNTPIVRTEAHGGINYRVMWDRSTGLEYVLAATDNPLERDRRIDQVMTNCFTATAVDFEGLLDDLKKRAGINKGPLRDPYKAAMMLNRNHRVDLDETFDAGVGVEADDFIYEAIVEFAGRQAFAMLSDTLMHYNGRYWREFPLQVAATDIRNALLEHTGWWARGVHGSIAARTEEAYRVLCQIVKQRPGLFQQRSRKALNCLNGEVWFDDDGLATLKPHDPESGFLSVLDIEYDADARCPLLVETVNELFMPPRWEREAMSAADLAAAANVAQEMGEYCLQALAYMVVPSRWLASYFVFEGPGSNGKSMLMGLIGELIGNGQVSTMPLEKVARDPHAEAFLMGKSLWYEDDMKTGFALPDEFFKRFSEDGMVTANPKNRTPFSFQNTAALALCTNTSPALKDVSPGIKRRAHVFPMRRRFALPSDLGVLPESERIYYDNADAGRKAALLEQREGMLAELAAAYGRLVHAGSLVRPAAAQRAVLEFFIAGAPLEAFYHECCVFMPKAETRAADLKMAVDQWSDGEGMAWHPSAHQIKDQILKIEPRIEHRRRNSGVMYVGLQIRGDRSGIGAVSNAPTAADFGLENECADGPKKPACSVGATSV